MSEEPEKLQDLDDLVEGTIIVKQACNVIDEHVDRLIAMLENQNQRQAH